MQGTDSWMAPGTPEAAPVSAVEIQVKQHSLPAPLSLVEVREVARKSNCSCLSVPDCSEEAHLGREFIHRIPGLLCGAYFQGVFSLRPWCGSGWTYTCRCPQDLGSYLVRMCSLCSCCLVFHFSKTLIGLEIAPGQRCRPSRAKTVRIECVHVSAAY